MSMNSDVISALSTVNLPKETGMYTGTALNYIVLVPTGRRNEDIADDKNLSRTDEMYVNLYYVGNYLTIQDTIETLLESAGFFISESNYIEIDTETKQHHYVFTIEKKTVL